jgi:group I intron endonuclease
MLKDNIPKKDISWYNLDKNGHIDKSLENKPAVYMFMHICSEKIYVGSSAKLKNRLSFHRSRIKNWNKDYNNNNGSLLFYNSVLKYGWTSFKFGILEFVDVSDAKQYNISKVLLEKEQYYLDNIKPTLNICKIAGSSLGVKHDISFSTNLSKARRGKKNKTTSYKTRARVILPDTILKLSSRSKGIKVKIFDKLNNLIKEFPTLTSAAKYVGVSARTMGRILNTGVSYDDFIYEFYILDRTPVIIHKENEGVKKYYSLRAAAKDIGVTLTTLLNYINTNKILKNIYRVYR